MADSSPSKRVKDLTNLEMEARTLINEEILGPAVTDEEKYEELLEGRKQRKAGEQLYDFLERQVGDQMRNALGQPLQNISENILNRVISKNIQADLRKYKMGKKTGREVSNERGRTKSPAVGRRVRPDVDEEFTAELDQNHGDLSKEVSQYINMINTSAGSKMSLIKMLVMKADENTNNYARMRNCFNRGDIDEADRLLANLEECNHQALLDLQNEIQDGPNTVAIIQNLCAQLKTERMENAGARARSPGKYASNRQRSTSANRTRGGPPAAEDTTKFNQQLVDLRREIHGLQEENDKLQGTMRQMVDDYTKQLEYRDENIRQLQMNIGDDNEPALRNQISEYVRDNRQLTDKISSLNMENSRLIQNLQEKERHIERQSVDQKNEWAEIYGNQKQQSEGLQRKIGMLETEKRNIENRLRDAERATRDRPAGGDKANEETTKRLKKRELECQALWDTIKDLQGGLDTNLVLSVLKKRALDTKANRKLGL